MAGKVLSFRVDGDVVTELEKRKLPGESSVAIVAQRLLSELLGIVRIDESVLVPVWDAVALLTQKVEALASGAVGHEVEELGSIIKTSELDGHVQEIIAKRLPSIWESIAKLEGRSEVQGNELKQLGDSYNVDIPQLKNSVWLLEQKAQVSKPQKTQGDETLSQLKCLGCGQVGGHKKSGYNRQGKQMYYCSNPDHTTREGNPLRSHKFEFISEATSSDTTHLA